MISGGHGSLFKPRFPVSVWVVLLVVAVGSTWISPSSRELFIGDETKYSRVLHELTLSDGILVLELEGEPFTHKPPLHFWVLLLLEHAFGLQSVWTFVLPSLVSFIVSCALTGIVSRRLGAGNPLVAAAIFATFWLAWVLAQTARMDMMFVALIASGSILVFESLEHERRGALLAGGVCYGLAVLVKGPMAAVIAIVLYAAERLVRARSDEPRRRRWIEPAGALLVMMLIPLAWLIPAIGSAGAGFGEELLSTQTLGRVIGSWTHAEPPWFYILRFPLTFFPWFVLVIPAAWHALTQTEGEERRRVRFLVIWITSVLVPFSLISGKLDVYMLPAMVPAAVLSAWYLKFAARVRLPASSLVIVVLMTAVCVLGGIVAPAAAELENDARIVARPVVRGLFWMTAAAGCAGLLVGWRRRHDSKTSAVVLGLVALVPLLYIAIVLIPTANDEASTVRLVRALERTGAPPTEIGLYWTPHLWSRSMPEVFHRVRYDEPDELRDDPPGVVAVRRDHTEDLGGLLESYRLIDQVRMAGDDFDVYGRRD